MRFVRFGGFLGACTYIRARMHTCMCAVACVLALRLPFDIFLDHLFTKDFGQVNKDVIYVGSANRGVYTSRPATGVWD